APLNLNLSGHLLQVQDHELSRLQRCKSDDDVYYAQISIVVRRRLFVALDEIGILAGLSLKGALPEEIVQEGSHVESDLCIPRLIVWFEDPPLQTSIETLFNVKSQPADRNVLILAGEAVVSVIGARPPVHNSVWKDANRVHPPRIGYTVFSVRQFVFES